MEKSDSIAEPSQNPLGKENPKASNLLREGLEWRLIGSDKQARIIGEEEKPGKINYLKGNDSRKWKRDVSTFRKIRYLNVYKNIDLLFYGNQRNIQYDFDIHPGGNPDLVRFSFPSAGSVKREPSGDLTIAAKLGKISLSRPYAYQIDESGVRQEIKSDFVISPDRTISFRLGSYDHSKELVIDPVLTYSTLLGGSLEDVGNAIKADSSGNAYVTGSTRSVEFPTSPAGRKPIVGTTDAFVTKLNPLGTDIVYSTVIGSSVDDVGYDIDVDGNGDAYVVGMGGTNFPQQNALKYYSSLYSSQNNTNNWQGTIGINIPISAIATDPQNPLVAYAGGNGGVYKTTNAGANWGP